MLKRDAEATLQNWQFLKNINILFPYNPAIPLPGTDTRETKAYAHAKMCMQIFVTALLIITPNWKQFKYPSTGK